jgi:hypothetical protein
MKKTSWFALIATVATCAIVYRRKSTTKALKMFLEWCTENRNFGIVGVGLSAFGNIEVTVNPEKATDEKIPAWFGLRRIVVRERRHA